MSASAKTFRVGIHGQLPTKPRLESVVSNIDEHAVETTAMKHPCIGRVLPPIEHITSRIYGLEINGR